jgi:diguanylate cyclase (GGDEF)-like protein
MVFSSSADLNDMVTLYKRQTYLFAFPFGIAMCLMYTLWVAEAGSFRFYMAIAMMVELGLMVATLWLLPHRMRVVEYVFYLSFSVYFFALTQNSISLYAMRDGLNPTGLSEVLNSLSMWLIVFLLGAYLTTPRPYLKFLLVFIFICMSAMAAGNFWSLNQLGSLQFPFIFRWVNPFASLCMATLLIQRMGVLQQRHASTDMLTGLLNRRALYQILEREMERTVRYKKPFSVVLFDLDEFKAINDSYGHLKGDAVLRELSRFVEQAIRKADRLGRWGGEEFLIVLPETDLESAQLLAERICRLLRENCIGKVDRVTASFGVTTFRGGRNLEDVLRAADNAMYQAKQNGRGQVVVV